ncbi:aminopeptidase [Paenibacillus xerothermodurans]|uniref:Aminopeptidase n=1 Tax=Paenibacillus xerothermodurans TaxID=1977292 RepID=A0A2W1NDP3_PAEXE|nr:aminopeptidase [Paenibacillus xerothermodurans]PZE21730.1 aminopeptidase [Paenibacillus xerothermodurans]
MVDFNEKLEKYAALAVQVGVNVQPGQTLVVTAPLASAAFVRMIAKRAYAAGANNVHIEWYDDEITRIKYDMAPAETFKEYPMWRARGWEEMAENNAAFLSIVASNPDLLKGVDPQKIADANKAAGQALQKYRSYAMSDKISWSIVAVPSEDWAAKVFPDADENLQMESLWNAIFDATRINTEDPIAAWREHTKTLDAKAARLNEKNYRALHYQGEGTDLTIELPQGHLWVSGGSENAKGTPFVANMPTEEVFTAPKKDGVNGTVRSTKPLSYGGNLIKDISVTFDKGKIVDIQAAEGLDVLKRLIQTDEGAAYLGEVALVPHRSPISETNLVFYNTLFDENASSHLAIGNAYAFCLAGGKEMSEEELTQKGLNSSIVHVDFMIGSADMNIDGELPDGTKEAVFREGNWAF